MNRNMVRLVLVSIVLVLTAVSAVLFAFSPDYPLRYGLDLRGGTELVYQADTSAVPANDVEGRIEALQVVIERRVNALGVSEPIVFTENSFTTGEYRLIVQLPGVTDPEEAKRQIGKTPLLNFGLVRYSADGTSSIEALTLDGSHITDASVQYATGATGHVSNEPVVVVTFNNEGAKIFADTTRSNVGEPLAIILDGEVISTPVIRAVISGGVTQIEGNFTEEEARSLADDLSLGALPVPIELDGSSSVSPTLGQRTVEQGVYALLAGFALIVFIFLAVYRSLGVIAVLSLIVYATLMMILFKTLGVVFTAAGLVGFGMSLGFAVDANVLICERIREQLSEGKTFKDAARDGFTYAFAAIRDANLSTIIIALILYWFSTSLVKGFALTFGLGVIVSMVTGYSISRVFTTTYTGFVPKPPRWLLPSKKTL